MFLLYPSTTFCQVQEDGELVQKNHPGTNLVFLRTTVGVPSTFSFANFNFQVPERLKDVHIFWGQGSSKVPIRNSQSPGPEHAWYK